MVWALVNTLAQADTFIHPPETYASGWTTPFPYQRNINMPFAVSPVGSPGSGIPGAVYEGTLDSALKISDVVTFDASASWYDTVSGVAATGLIGIDNRLGSDYVTGTAVVQVANISYSGGTNNVWLETLAIASGGGSGATIQLLDSLGNPATIVGWDVTPYGGAWLGDYQYRIIPNTPGETIRFRFEAPAGQYIFLDGVHLATATLGIPAIPEPATFSLLAMGALAVLWWRGRKQVLR